jgi:hypothetical protein
MEYHYLLLIIFIVIFFILCILAYYLYDSSKKTYLETLLPFLVIASLFITLCFYYVTIQTQQHNYEISKQNNTKNCNDLLDNTILTKDLQEYTQEDIINARKIFSYWDTLLSLSQHSTLNVKIIVRRLLHFSFNTQLKEFWNIYRKNYHNLTKKCGDFIFANIEILNNNNKTEVKQLKQKLVSMIKNHNIS